MASLQLALQGLGWQPLAPDQWVDPQQLERRVLATEGQVDPAPICKALADAVR